MRGDKGSAPLTAPPFEKGGRKLLPRVCANKQPDKSKFQPPTDEKFYFSAVSFSQNKRNKRCFPPKLSTPLWKTYVDNPSFKVEKGRKYKPYRLSTGG